MEWVTAVWCESCVACKKGRGVFNCPSLFDRIEVILLHIHVATTVEQGVSVGWSD